MNKRTNIELDVALIKEALEISPFNTIKDVVHYSLQEMIKMNKRKKMLTYKGKIDWEGDLEQMRQL
ncbi:MAG: type II toxin-antitoxin system VapB family antitoxin [Cyclobacteriaceae bacterium]|nr:type II toxin-antitoxin system VapB family antitoxin [Cyclobacteriaceae bacterium]